MLLRTKCAGMPIHIPLDIGNWRGIKNLADAFDDMIPHLRLRKVEQQLVAASEDRYGQGCHAAPSPDADGTAPNPG